MPNVAYATGWIKDDWASLGNNGSPNCTHSQIGLSHRLPRKISPGPSDEPDCFSALGAGGSRPVIPVLASGDYQHAAADQDGTGDQGQARLLAQDNCGQDQGARWLQEEQQGGQGGRQVR